MFPFGAFVFSSQFLIAVADGVPNIDVTKTCRNSATVTGTLTQEDVDACIADEQGAGDGACQGLGNNSPEPTKRNVYARQPITCRAMLKCSHVSRFRRTRKLCQRKSRSGHVDSINRRSRVWRT